MYVYLTFVKRTAFIPSTNQITTIVELYLTFSNYCRVFNLQYKAS